MNIIAIANHKGGCGKTTTAINLSASFSREGKRVLLIDLDPQGHATIGLNVTEDKFQKNMYDVLSNLTNVGLNDIIIPVSENLDLAPSNVLLSAIEQQLSGITDREKRLAGNIDNLKREYDFIIIDCPPSLGILTINALIACSEVIIPIETSFFSLHGIMKLLETINVVEEKSKYVIKYKALVTMYDRRKKFDQEVVKNIKDYFKEKCFDTVIRNTVKLKECASFGCPITQYDTSSYGFEDYINLSNEVLQSWQMPLYRKEETRFEEAVPAEVWDEVIFSFWAPDAKMVQLAGDFNNWSPEENINLENKGNGLWEKKLILKPGEYQYKYVVDGNWRVDPNNPLKVCDNSGYENSLLKLNQEN
ncbi:MAG: hypothetical protein A2149_08355 [Candidatus Schekmanbacteria bacterium RBG_16_38_11]|uniref:AAA domain-containing protein n=2 Tax=Bacteria candidate phyla TaxID=1783234 RepID=A0A1F7RTR7_9BACT|nr:MAG: ATPase involved in chromosome partitioning [Candidatus Gottesmanbacteria bacterium GW2011_GWC2_39_8]OGL44277.1 MAG: hypothetical protein A2149_08355 [Candidatus Schekmanbacteria bacterium RBG_16_38_11]